MRANTVVAMLLVWAGLSGCATSRPPAFCAQVDAEQQMVASMTAIERTFGPVRAGYYALVESRTTDARGDFLITYHRIGPATAEQPPEGQGARLTVVVQRCTGKLLRFYRP